MQVAARLSSSAASRRVIAGVSRTITRFSYRASRGKAHAAPLSAQEPPPKGQKRISKQERRVRIEEFVEKYRASNEGRFPSITIARQQVGGGHYTVREILQELEYNYANPPLNNDKVAQVQGTAEFAKHSKPKDEPKAAQVKETAEFAERASPKDDSGKNLYSCETLKNYQQDDALISQEDAITSSGTIIKTETWRSMDSSHGIVETEAAKPDLNTSYIFKSAAAPTLSDQTESDSMKNAANDPSLSFGVKAKSDPVKQEGEEKLTN